MDAQTWQWILVIGSSILLFLIAPFARSANTFFKATTHNREPRWWLLTSSLVISWIFAKSITVAANLGADYGLVGGIAYAAYYVSFVVAGVVLFQLRVRGGFASIHQFLQSRFGRSAVAVFSLLIGIRLFNEVWSNTMVIGSYFGEAGSSNYYMAIVVFTALTLAYALKGGLRSSLITDLIQLALFGVLLCIILGVLLPASDATFSDFAASGKWSLSMGGNLLLVALLQSLSYPFHDPVLTDRAFIASPRVTLKSYLLAAAIGSVCIVLFSFVGIYAQMQGLEGQAPVVVAQSLGVGMMLVMNTIMVTSAASTLDSTFASFSKLWVVDLKRSTSNPVRAGRLVMVVIAMAGTLPVFTNATILEATTVSGTMVMGLAPVFLWWRAKVTPLSFQLAVWPGIVLGIVLAAGKWPESLVFFPGKYGDFLSVNVLGLPLCTLGYFLPAMWPNSTSSAQ